MRSLYLLLILLTPVFAATINVGGLTFDEAAFADDVINVTGSWSLTGASTVRDALIGTNLNTIAASSDNAAYADVIFNNNIVINGSGADLVVFEASGAGSAGLTGCLVTLKINGITKTYTPTWLNTTPNNIYISYVNLDDFGIAANSYISSFRILGNATNHPDYVAFAAIYTPEPSTFILFGLVCFAIYYMKK